MFETWFICCVSTILIVLLIFIAFITQKVIELMRSINKTGEQINLIEASIVKIVSHMTSEIKSITNNDNSSLIEKNSIVREQQTKRRLKTFDSINSDYRSKMSLFRWPSRLSSKRLNIMDNNNDNNNNDNDKENINTISFKKMDTENFPFVCYQDSCIINIDKKLPNCNHAIEQLLSQNENAKSLDLIHDEEKCSENINVNPQSSTNQLVEFVRKEFDKSYNRMINSLNQNSDNKDDRSINTNQ